MNRRRIRKLFNQRRLLFGLNLTVNIVWFFLNNRELQLTSFVVVLISNFFTAGGFTALVNLRKPAQRYRNLLTAVTIAAPFLLLIIKTIAVLVWWIDGNFRIDATVAILDALSTILIFYTFEEDISLDDAFAALSDRARNTTDGMLRDRVTRTGEFIILDKENRPDLVMPMSNVYIPEIGSVEIGQSLKECFERAERRLLVLGAPGAGKTTSLYQLASSLLADSATFEEGDFVQARQRIIPIIIDLKHWELSRAPLETWLIKELDHSDLSRPLLSLPLLRGKGKRSNNNIVLFLDGLDEMKTDAMRQCLAEINDFLSPTDTSITRPKIVITCRYTEYVAATAQEQDAYLRLALNNAIVLQPLREEQIEKYLSIKQSNFDLHEDYLDILSNPLMLYAVVRVAETEPDILEELHLTASEPALEAQNLQSASPNNLTSAPSPTKQVKEDQIFKRYINHAITEYSNMPRDKQDKRPEPRDPKFVRGQLAWLARHMRNNQFLLDDIQPRWLLKASAKNWFNLNFISWLIIYLLASRTILSLIVAFGTGLFLADPFENLLAGLYAAVFVTIFDLVRFGLRGRASQQNGQTTLPQTTRFFRAVVGFLTVFVGTSIIFSILFGTQDLYVSSVPPINVAGLQINISGITRGIFLALFFGAYLGVGRADQSLDTDIGTIDELSSLAWGNALLRGVTWAAVVGSVIGAAALLLYYGPVNQQTSIWLDSASALSPLGDTPSGWFSIGGGVGAIAGFIFGLMFGSFKIKALIPNRIVQPDRSVGMSVRYALQLPIIFGGLCVVLFSIVFYSITFDIDSVVKAILIGIAIGILTSPYYGGIALINFTVLRIIFFIRGLPYDFLSRLNNLKKTTLIQRRYRGYEFYHDRVFEYFKQEEPIVFEEHLQFRRLSQVVTIGVVICAAVLALWYANGQLYRYDVPNDAIFVEHNAEENVISSYCYQQGEEIQLQSKGSVRAGVYVGYVSPQGTEVGFLGLPLFDGYDIVPEFPNSSLICRVNKSSTWKLCATTDLIIPYSWHSASFVAERSGCLEFAINDIEPSGHLGGFWVVPAD